MGDPCQNGDLAARTVLAPQTSRPTRVPQPEPGSHRTKSPYRPSRALRPHPTGVSQ
jgi:hypothetical protein